jgi:hypothetical protein
MVLAKLVIVLMRIIANKALREFWQRHRDAEAAPFASPAVTSSCCLTGEGGDLRDSSEGG